MTPVREDSIRSVLVQSNHFDANESVFLTRELNHVMTEVYKTLYAPRNAEIVMPIGRSISEGAKTFTWKESDRVGKAKVSADMPNDIPMANVFLKENTGVVRNVTIGYKYDVLELKAAAKGNFNLLSEELSAAVEGHSDTINTIAWYGDAANNLPGLFTNSSIPSLTLPADGTGSSKTFATKTADQMIRDVGNLINTVREQSKGTLKATDVWMPLAQFGILERTKTSTASDTTVLAFLRNVYPDVTFRVVDELDGAGAGGTDRMYALANSQQNFSLEVPMQLQQFAPQLTGLVYIVPMLSRIAGVLVKRPLALVWADGI